jgi:Domain of unknown function (DUF5134)
LIGPSWLAPGVAALMLLVTATSTFRLARWRRRRPVEPDVDALHAMMGIAMAGMLLPQLSVVPGRVWQAVFGVAAGWFAARAIGPRAWRADGRRFTHPAPHVVECAAMLYMLIPARSQGAAGMAMPGLAASSVANPVVTLLFAVFLVGYVLSSADQLTARAQAAALADGRSAPHGPRPWSAPHVSGPRSRPDGVLRFTIIDKIVMGTAMGYMLLAML